MKDSAKRLANGAAALALAASALSAGGCSRNDRTADVAQDSILVKDADVAEHKTDTAAAGTAALVRERGAIPETPSLISGAPVRRSADVAGSPGGTLQPPRRVNPSPVLPAREPIPTRRTDTAPTSPTPSVPPLPATQPMPVSQPVSPQPQPVSQPSVVQPQVPTLIRPLPTPPPPAPKKDSSRDSISIVR